MIVRALLIIALLLPLASAAQAADRTSALLAELDRCDHSVSPIAGPKLDVLLSLADGRSARQLAAVLGGPRSCIGYVSTFGEGADELVFVGGIGVVGATGALLWVDDGWWRIATLPLGYISGTREVRRVGEGREFFAGIGSGGSAGTIGVIGVRLVGAKASVMLRLLPGGELSGARLIDDDHLYVEGRLTSDRLLTWGSHPTWPYGAQWLFERRGDEFVLVADRQSRDPYYLMTGFVGALFQRDAATMRRFATDEAVAAALDLPQLDRRIDGLQLFADRSFAASEQLSWSALPDSVRTIAPSGPVWGSFTNYDYWSRTVYEVRLRFDRIGDGWVITAVELLGPRGPNEAGLVP